MCFERGSFKLHNVAFSAGPGVTCTALLTWLVGYSLERLFAQVGTDVQSPGGAVPLRGGGGQSQGDRAGHRPADRVCHWQPQTHSRQFSLNPEKKKRGLKFNPPARGINPLIQVFLPSITILLKTNQKKGVNNRSDTQAQTQDFNSNQVSSSQERYRVQSGGSAHPPGDK